MANFLIDHAIQHISASRYQDRQYIFKAKSITKDSGVINNFELMGRFINTPVNNSYYHVYNIGRVPLKKLGLLTRYIEWLYEKWYSFQSAIVIKDLWVTIYTTEGIEVPKNDSHYMLTNEGDLIVAINKTVKLPITFIDSIYIRLYSNSYFNSTRSSHLAVKTYSSGIVTNSTQDILTIQNDYNVFTNREGAVVAHVNGFLVDTINLLTVNIGDLVEFDYDSSIKKVIDIPISDLNTFTSALDSKLKYLIHYPDDTPNSTDGDIIDYHDDIDIYVTYDDGTTFKGVYYNRNVVDSYRMVTHRDYSIPVDYLVFVANSLSRLGFNNLASINNMSIRLIIRHSGFDRKLEYDTNRLFELYKLDDVEVLQAMVGINSSLSIWQASNLESSAYTKLMRSFSEDVSEQNVIDAYGFNGLSKIVGDTPSKTILELGSMVADLPYILTDNSTVYEYDSNGLLTNVVNHISGGKYITNNLSAVTIECLSGKGSDSPHVVFGSDNISIDTVKDYRVYRSFIVDGVSDENWEDITGSDKYVIDNGVLLWSNTEFNQLLMVRYDDSFLDYDLPIDSVEGNLFFTLSELEDRGNGVTNYTLPVPLAQLDIWMNGRSLIEDIDYKVVFPIVYILNKKYLISPADTTTQQLHIRMYGFPDSLLKRDVNEDIGFIEHGVLSNNNRFDIRDDKVLRITVDGSIKTIGDVILSEQHNGVSIINASNGLPYQIKDIITPLKTVLGLDTYTLRNDAIVRDNLVADYMSLKLPQPIRNGLSSIPAKYNLVSPFFATIISHLQVDIITDSMIAGLTSDTLILDFMSTYEYLLAWDILGVGNTLSPSYVSIHPILTTDPKVIPISKYTFLLNIVRLYGKGLIDITNFITVTA